MVQGDGKIVVGGIFLQAYGTNSTEIVSRPFIARFNADGSVDTGYNPTANGPVTALALQGDGKIILGGQFTTLEPPGSTDWTQRNYIARLNTDGTIDTAFDPNANAQVRALLTQTDGTILVGGAFTTLQPNGGATTIVSLPIARLKADGSVDNGFAVSAGATDGSQVSALVVQPDGRIVAGGAFTALAGATSSNLVRFKTNNAVDTSFIPAPVGSVNALAVLSNNAGIATPLPNFAWIDQVGTLVPGFKPTSEVQLQGQIEVIALQPGTGQIILGGTFTNVKSTDVRRNLVRFNADGTLDTSFNPAPDGPVHAILVRKDTGQIIVGGGFTDIDGVVRGHVAQLNSDGSLDTLNPTASDSVNAVLLQADGKLVLGGAFTTVQPGATGDVITRNRLARFNTDGTLDTSFDPNADNSIYTLAQQADGKILVGGTFTSFTPNSATTTVTRNSLARLNLDGTPDTAFDPNGGNYGGTVTSLVVQPNDQMILVGGTFTKVGGWTRNGIARLQTTGDNDASFDPNVNGQVATIALQKDGSILVAGSFISVGRVTRNQLARIHSDGSLDLNFDPDPNDQVNAVVALDDGTIMIGGFFTGLRTGGTLLVGGNFASISGVATHNLARLKDDGGVDGTFLPNPDGVVNALILQPDKKFVVGGDFTHLAGVAHNRLARFNADGSLDPAFNASSLGAITALALQTDGKILAAALPSSGVTAQTNLARFNVDGSLDATFAGGLFGTVNALALQADGRILVGGTRTLAGVSTPYLSRLKTDGTTDASFAPAVDGAVNSLAVQTDGKIIVGGVFTHFAGVARNRLARLNADGSIDTTFDPNANGGVNTMLIQTDGKVLVGGAFNQVSNQGRGLIARISATTPVSENLTLSSDHTTILWTRLGSGPELASAVFEQLNNDGLTWTLLGPARRVTGTSNWQLGALNVSSTLSTVYLRARGFVPTAQGGSTSLIESVWQFSLSTTSGSNYIGVAADLAGGNTGGSSTSGSAAANAVGATVSATPAADAGTGTQSSDAAAAAGRFISLSARATVSDGYPLITGFVISGSSAKSVLLRAVGPGLSGFGVTAPLAAPRMQIYNNATLLYAINTGWDASGDASNLIAVFNRLGEFPLAAGSADAATLVTLSPGAYTVVIPDGQGSGTVLAEVYDADASTASGAVRFTGLSARSQVTVGDPLIAGLAISGNTARRVLVRGWGPALAKVGVSGVLSDPLLTVYDSQNQLLAQNDNWQTQTTVNSTQTLGSITDVVSACVAVFDSGSKDSALIITLAPGTYTIQLSGVNHTAGAVMVEAYDLSP